MHHTAKLKEVYELQCGHCGITWIVEVSELKSAYSCPGCLFLGTVDSPETEMLDTKVSCWLVFPKQAQNKKPTPISVHETRSGALTAASETLMPFNTGTYVQGCNFRGDMVGNPILVEYNGW